MVMTHYMELLSLHSPWFLILFMLVPMVLAETILASGAFSLLYKDHRSEKWDSLSHICGIILGVFFIIATVYIVTSYIPTIQWRGPIDMVSIWAYVLGVIPAVLILLQELGIIFKNQDSTSKIKNHIVLMILFVPPTWRWSLGWQIRNWPATFRRSRKCRCMTTCRWT